MSMAWAWAGTLVPPARTGLMRREVSACGGAGGMGDDSPGVRVGEARGQVQHDSADGGSDAGSDFEEGVAEGRDLSASELGARGSEAQLLHEDVGGGGEEDAELVGEEARAAGAVDLEAVVQLLDPVL